MADRARQAVETHDDKDVAGADLFHEAGELGARARGAGAVLLEDRLAACAAQLVGLGVGRLVFGRDAGIAEEAAGGGWPALSLLLKNFNLKHLAKIQYAILA